MTLQELYDEIKDLNPMPLVPDVLSSGNINEFLANVTADGEFIINDPHVVPIMNEEEEIIEVSVEGESSSFGLGASFPVELNFVTKFNELYLDLSSDFIEQKLTMPGIDWFAISDVYSSMQIYDADQFNRGTYNGQISILPNVIFSMDYPITNSTWVFNANLEDPVGISDVIALCNGASLIESLPPPMKTFVDLKVYQVGMSYNAASGELEYMNIYVSSETEWQILPQLALNSINLEGIILKPASTDPQVNYTVKGEFQIGDPETDNGLVNISASMPNLQIYGELQSGSELYLIDLLNLFLPGVTSNNFESRFTIFKFLADPTNTNYTITGELLANWELLSISDLVIELYDISANFSYLNGNTTGGLTGTIVLQDKGLDDTDEVVMEISAEHPEAGDDWTFSGKLTDGSELDVKKLLAKFLGTDLLPEGSEITINNLEAVVHSTSTDYSFKVSVNWGNIFGEDIPITISDTTLNIASKDGVREGYISGTANFQGVDLKLEYTFTDDPEKANTIRLVIFDIISELNVTDEEKVLTVNPQDQTVGDIITKLVNAASPGSGITLPKPWDLLNTISLKGFTFMVNFTQKKVGFTYKINTNLGFVNISNIALYYTFDSEGNDKKVEIELEGSFLGQSMPSGWDVLDPDAAPEVPGQGNNKFDLKFLGIGQMVGMDTPVPSTVSEGVDNMMEAFSNPPEAGTSLFFDQSVNWLVGTRFAVMNMINIDAIFYDPILYGLSIGVTDGKFKGLDFEILYKKVSDNIGVYQILLSLPDFIRQLEFGAVTITLPNVGVWIYTNGDFKLDFGFPNDGDFSGSFGVQLLPFVGSGGFYFGILSTQTASQLPANYDTDCGDFDPVIVFGLGLRLGLGKSINKGILKAELSLTIQGIIEGTLAFFNAYPDENGNLPVADDNKPVYYYIQGQIALVGKIFGEVNFAIISASLDITVSISARAVIEAYEATMVNFTASVSVSLKVKVNMGIFSIKIRLSFETTITESFTLGSASNDAPWNCTNKISTARTPYLLSLTEDSSCPTIPEMNWQPVYIDPEEDPKSVPLYYASQFSMSSESLDGVSASDSLVGVAMMYIRSNSNEEDEEAPPFSTFARGVLTWVFNAYYNKDINDPTEADVLDKTVTQDDLREMYCYLSQADETDNKDFEPFTYENIIDFLSNYYEFSVSLPPTEMIDDQDTDTGIFPVFPLLSLTTPTGTNDFGEGASIQFTREELNEIKAYFKQLSADQNESGDFVEDAIVEETQSLANYIFVDYFTMIAKSSVQSALDKMQVLEQEVQPDLNLLDLNSRFAHSGISQEEFAFTNRLHPLTPGIKIIIPGAKYTYKSKDTQQLLADTYGFDIQLLHESQYDTSYLKGRTINLPEFEYEIRENDNLKRIAGQFRTSVAQIASRNINVRNLFDTSRRIKYANVESINAGDLLDIMEDQFVFNNLSGLAARVLLQGLRPLGPEGSIYAGQPTPFYALSLQEFDANSLAVDDQITLSITDGEPLDWLKLDNGVSIDMPITEDLMQDLDNLKSAAFNPVIEELQAMDLAGIRPKNFTLPTQISWKKPENDLEVGTSDPSIWPLSADLSKLLQTDNDPLPTIKLFKQVQAHENIAPPAEEVPNPKWAIKLDVRISRIPEGENTMYEMLGAGQTDNTLLEELLRYYDDNPTSFIDSIEVLYPEAPAQADQQEPPSGLQSDNQEDVSQFLVQSNLSTVSNPPSSLAISELTIEESNLVGQTPIEFLKLLWECGITASGGYYFYYESGDGEQSLPDYLFNDDPIGVVTLLVNLNLTDGIPGFVNAAVLEETIDTSEELLFAQVEYSESQIVMNEGESLHDIKKNYFTDIFSIAKQNPTARLKGNTLITIPTRKYLVKENDELITICNRFNIPLADLASQNNEDVTWSLSGETWIDLPSTTHLLDEAIGLDKISTQFNVNPIELLHVNAHVPGLFVDSITFDNRIEEKICNVPNGSVGFTLQRSNPEEVADVYQQQLLELYNLLEYSIAEAGIFKASNPAIPSWPTNENDEEDSDMDKSFAVPEITDEPWKFSGVIPAYRFVKDLAPPVEGLPDPEENPYNAIQGESQENVTLDFAWNDLFGNTLNVSGSSNGSTWPTLNISIGYTDQIVAVSQWRNVLPRYIVQLEDDTPKLIVNFRFLSDRYTDISDPDAKKENAETDAKLYQLIYYQLNQDDVEVSFSTSMDGEDASLEADDLKDELIAFVGAIYTFLTDIAEGNTPTTPENIALTWSISDNNSENVFLFEVKMHITRNILLVADEFKDQLSSSEVISTIKPDLNTTISSTNDVENDPLSLTEFATELQTAFPELKVLTGPPNTATEEVQDEIWLARFSTDSDGIWMSIIDPGTPNYYAIKPLSVNLISDLNMMVYSYQSGTPICESQMISNPVNSIDMELMASSFLTAVDLFLSSDYIIKAWLNEQEKNGNENNCIDETPYESLIQSKKDIAKAISENLTSIFSDSNPSTANSDQAKEVLYQELLIQLSNAYKINTVVQFDVCMQASVDLAANLFGKAISPTLENSAASSQSDEVPYSLNSSKVGIPTSSEDSCYESEDGNKNLTFTFSAKNPEEQAFMELTLDYVVSAMEVNIREVPGIQDYKASEWLSFVLPFEVSGLSTSLGDLSIPIPLKIYPTPPSVLSQSYSTPISESNLQADSPTEELEKSKKWQYAYSYNYNGASQDTIDANILTNLAVKNLQTELEEEVDLFTALVQFTNVYPAIQSDLNQYLIKNEDAEMAYTAIQSLAWLISRVAGAWGSWDSDKVKYETIFESTAGFELQISQLAYTPEITIDNEDDTSLLLVEVTSEKETQLPLINIEGYNAVPLTELPTINEEKTAQYIYQNEVDPNLYLSYEVGKELPNRTVQMSLLYDIMEEENASGGISIIRNQDLGSGRSVNNDFIYRTPEIRMINPVVPLLNPNLIIQLSDFSPSGKNDLADYLSNFFEVLFADVIPEEGEVQRLINLKGSYSYLLVSSESENDTEFRTKLPIFLTTPYEFNIPGDWALGNPDSFVNKISTEILKWFEAHNPKRDGGLFLFDLFLFSNLTDSNLPILTYENMELDIDLISNL
ncbi:MAG: LysM peptidoglycan-binding domain-containing protein [Bacteroidota bacterium]